MPDTMDTTIVDDELIEDFFEAFGDLFDELVTSIEELNKLNHPPSASDIAATYRALHTIKGNLLMVRLPEISEMVHYLENLLEEIKQQQITYCPQIGEVILLCVDEIQIMAKHSFDGEPQDQEFSCIFNAIKQINTTNQAKRTEALQVALNILDPFNNKGTGHSVSAAQDTESTLAPIKSHGQEIITDELKHRYLSTCGYKYVVEDLEFFETIAQTINFRLKSAAKKITTTAMLSIEMNKLADSPIDEKQLLAASLLLNWGVALLPMTTHNKESINAEERKKIRQNPVISSTLLDNMPFWRQAQNMILEVHEQINGQGYPNGLAGSKICEGAKVLSIAQAFASTLYNRPFHRLTSRTIMASIMEINKGIDSQFCPKWMMIFNEAVKQMHSKGLII